MTNLPASINDAHRTTLARLAFSLLAAAVLLTFLSRSLVAQDSPHVATVDPASGKAGAVITVTGTNLEKSRVSSVFLSDDKDDHKVTVVSQVAEKIVIKVPDVKHGDYNISVQSGNSILIQPIRFTVE